jgi:superfamily II DNA/RNA helicase
MCCLTLDYFYIFYKFSFSMQHCLAQPPVRRGDGPLALVLAPTRELPQQIEKEVR